MDIKKRGAESKFCRVSPGRYTLREYVQNPQPAAPLPTELVDKSFAQDQNPQA